MILRRVVFQVGVLNDDDGRRGVSESGPQGRAFALIERMANQQNARLVLLEGLKPFPGAVG